jgi:hypothetical protein
VFPLGIGLRDPRSQTRDLGHPSISPFDIAEGICFLRRPVTIDEGKGVLDLLASLTRMLWLPLWVCLACR